MNNQTQKDFKLGWNSKETEHFTPWLEVSTYQYLKNLLMKKKIPTPKPYALRKWHVSELSIKYSHQQQQIYLQIIQQHEQAGGAVSGYFTYAIEGTKDWAKELTLWLQGNEQNHDQDVEKFISMADKLNIKAAGYPIPYAVKQIIMDKNSKTQDGSNREIYVDDLGYGYEFSNFNAASARETWARQYCFKIKSPDRTAAIIARKSRYEKIHKVYSSSFHPSEWGLN